MFLVLKGTLPKAKRLVFPPIFSFRKFSVRSVIILDFTVKPMINSELFFIWCKVQIEIHLFA